MAELSTATRTSDFSTASGANTDVTSLTVTVSTGGNPIEVIFGCANMYNNAATGGVAVSIMEDATNLGDVATSIFSTANQTTPGSGRVRSSPSAGSHTYKVQLRRVIGGTAFISAGVGGVGVNAASYISVNEL